MAKAAPPSHESGGLHPINLRRAVKVYSITESELMNIFGLRALATLALAAASALAGYAFEEDGWANPYFFIASALLIVAMGSHYWTTKKIKDESTDRENGKATMLNS